MLPRPWRCPSFPRECLPRGFEPLRAGATSRPRRGSEVWALGRAAAPATAGTALEQRARHQPPRFPRLTLSGGPASPLPACRSSRTQRQHDRLRPAAGRRRLAQQVAPVARPPPRHLAPPPPEPQLAGAGLNAAAAQHPHGARWRRPRTRPPPPLHPCPAESRARTARTTSPTAERSLPLSPHFAPAARSPSRRQTSPRGHCSRAPPASWTETRASGPRAPPGRRC